MPRCVAIARDHTTHDAPNSLPCDMSQKPQQRLFKEICSDELSYIGGTLGLILLQKKSCHYEIISKFSGISLYSPESLDNCQTLLVSPHSGEPLESLRSRCLSRDRHQLSTSCGEDPSWCLRALDGAQAGYLRTMSVVHNPSAELSHQDFPENVDLYGCMCRVRQKARNPTKNEP